METSAKDNINIAEAFKNIINSKEKYILILLVLYQKYFYININKKYIETYINSILKDIVRNRPENIDKGECIKITNKNYIENKETSDQRKKCC